MSDGWEVTDNDRSIARGGIIIQLTSRGIDIESDSMKSYIDHETEVIASYAAQCRWLQNIVHKMTFSKEHK